MMPVPQLGILAHDHSFLGNFLDYFNFLYRAILQEVLNSPECGSLCNAGYTLVYSSYTTARASVSQFLHWCSLGYNASVMVPALWNLSLKIQLALTLLALGLWRPGCSLRCGVRVWTVWGMIYDEAPQLCILLRFLVVLMWFIMFCCVTVCHPESHFCKLGSHSHSLIKLTKDLWIIIHCKLKRIQYNCLKKEHAILHCVNRNRGSKSWLSDGSPWFCSVHFKFCIQYWHYILKINRDNGADGEKGEEEIWGILNLMIKTKVLSFQGSGYGKVVRSYKKIRLWLLRKIKESL